MEEYLKIIKSLSERTRIRILALLNQAQEVCVSEIVDTLEESQYKVSRHLKVLQEAGLVVGSKKGRWIYYQLNNNQVHFQDQILKAINYISSDILHKDLERLKTRLAKRVNNQCISGKTENYSESYQ